ncbi:hypothetical protein AX774_g5775 [Zancudomyces culisetae]|uniref:Uncharacterized protein n=1 Tax=Zancudomyces culisetae TaxID=1213189 RepID=A0A1R1PIL0_ZANCU|nr:hypothetical protein AX774_g5775 [Zancudomyces culisetae]|eukprot:OMH80786.1 hypothetical protein AX774_g5775 [Zancudomyces culisetae]
MQSQTHTEAVAESEGESECALIDIVGGFENTNSKSKKQGRKSAIDKPRTRSSKRRVADSSNRNGTGILSSPEAASNDKHRKKIKREILQQQQIQQQNELERGRIEHEKIIDILNVGSIGNIGNLCKKRKMGEQGSSGNKRDSIEKGIKYMAER